MQWLADRAEQIAHTAGSEASGWECVRGLCRRARVIACFCRLWAVRATRGAAMQLVAVERLFWPLPSGDVDPGELMEGILAWVDRHDAIVAESAARLAA